MFYLICYTIRFVKYGKTNKCSDEKIEEVIGSNVYRKLKNEKEYLQLNLDYQKREKICFQINEILSKSDYYLIIFEQKKKIDNIFKKDTEKKNHTKKDIQLYY